MFLGRADGQISLRSWTWCTTNEQFDRVLKRDRVRVILLLERHLLLRAVLGIRHEASHSHHARSGTRIRSSLLVEARQNLASRLHVAEEEIRLLSNARVILCLIGIGPGWFGSALLRKLREAAGRSNSMGNCVVMFVGSMLSTSATCGSAISAAIELSCGGRSGWPFVR